MFNQKRFIKIVLIIVALVLIGAVYFIFSKKDKNILFQNTEIKISQSSQPIGEDLSTSDWKTYRNEKYGLDFKYPSNWKIQEYKSEYIDHGISIGLDPVETISQSSYETLDRTPGLITITLSKKNPFNVLEKEYFESLEKSEIGQGISARKTEDKTGENEPNPYYFNRHILVYYFGSRSFEDHVESDFSIEYVSDLNDQYLKIFNQILATLKITH